MEILIVREPGEIEVVRRAAAETYGDMAKAVVDIGRGVLALGGELHADAEAVLLEDGSRQEHLWGVNLYPERRAGERVKYESFVNIRPSQGNRTMEVESPAVREQINHVLAKLLPGL